MRFYTAYADPSFHTYAVFGSRPGKPKIESLLFYLLQIAPDFRDIQVDRWTWVGWLNIGVLLSRSDPIWISYITIFFYQVYGPRGLKIGPVLFCVVQTPRTSWRFTNWKMNLWDAWLNIVVFIVPCSLNSTRTSAIYRLTDGLEGWHTQVFHCL